MAEFMDTMYKRKSAYIGNKYGKTAIKVSNIYDSNDGHMTVNFLKWGGRRSIENLSCLNALKFDLDTEKAGLSPINAFHLLEEDIFEKNRLPYPSFVINSGAGLHIYYKFDNVIRVDAIEVYKRLERAFCEYFKDYGIDIAASVNPVGVLRLPDTINEKHGNRVTVIYDGGHIYSFRDLCNEYLSYSDDEKPTEKQLYVIKRMENAFGEKFPENYKNTKANARKTIRDNFDRYLTYIPRKAASEEQIAYIKRICDYIGKDYPNIESSYEAYVWIQEHKAIYNVGENNIKGMNGIKALTLKVLNVLLSFIEDNRDNSYKREVILFYIRYCASYLYDEETGISFVLRANALLNEPFRESTILSLTKSATTYINTKKTLKIGVKTIAYKVTGNYSSFDCYVKNKPKGDRKEYQRKYQKNRYKNKLSEKGKKAKSEKIAIRRANIEKLMDKGLSAKEIATETGVGIGTVYNDISYIKEHKTDENIDNSKPEKDTKKLNIKLINKLKSFSKNSNNNILNIFDVRTRGSRNHIPAHRISIEKYKRILKKNKNRAIRHSNTNYALVPL